MEPARRIALAFAAADKTAGEALAAHLEARGLTVRRADLDEGLPWRTGPVVVLWSKKAETARAEVLRAIRAKARLTIARLDEARPPTAPGPFAADLRGWRGREDHRGLARLTAALNGAPAPPRRGQVIEMKARSGESAGSATPAAPPLEPTSAPRKGARLGLLAGIAVLLGALVAAGVILF